MSLHSSTKIGDENHICPIIPRLKFSKNPANQNKKNQGFKHIRMKSKLFDDDKVLTSSDRLDHNQLVTSSLQHIQDSQDKMFNNNLEQHQQQNISNDSPKLFKRPVSSYEGQSQVFKINLQSNRMRKKYSMPLDSQPEHCMQNFCSKMAQSIIINSEDNNYENYNNFNQVKKRTGISNDQFKRIKFLGQGKFGQVHLVKHIFTGFICALKVIEKCVVRQEQIQSQIAKQIRIQNQLKCMNVVELYGYFSDQRYFYILLQYAIEGSVFSKLKGRSRLQEDQIQPIAKGICDGLRFIHKMGFVHRDIKPQNIVLQFGVPKICDFGWATACDQTQLCKSYCGTPLYISPQMIRKQYYGSSVDIWAVGMIIYQLLVGRVPFRIWNQQDMNQIITKSIQFPSYIDRSLSCQQFIRKCLQKITVERIQLNQALRHPFITQFNQKEIDYQFFQQVKNVLNTSY